MCSSHAYPGRLLRFCLSTLPFCWTGHLGRYAALPTTQATPTPACLLRMPVPHALVPRPLFSYIAFVYSPSTFWRVYFYLVNTTKNWCWFGLIYVVPTYVPHHTFLVLCILYARFEDAVCFGDPTLLFVPVIDPRMFTPLYLV